MENTRTRSLHFQGRSYAAFLFDMDGTMLDSSAVVERVWHEWAARHGIDAAELMATVHGVRSEDTIRRFAPDGVDIAAEAEALLLAEIEDVEGVVPIAGIEAFVARTPSQFLGRSDVRDPRSSGGSATRGRAPNPQNVDRRRGRTEG